MFIRRTQPQQPPSQQAVKDEKTDKKESPPAVPSDGKEQAAQPSSEGSFLKRILREEFQWEDDRPIGDRPKLSREERALILKLRGKVHSRVIADFERGFARGIDMRNTEQVRPLVERVCTEISEQEAVALTAKLRQVLIQEVLDEINGFGPLEAFLSDPTITEVMVNSKDRIFYERGGRIYLSDQQFDSDEHILKIIDRIMSPLGRPVNERTPLQDGRLPDGSRVNVIIPPLALKGPSITVRKFFRRKLTIEDLIRFGSLTEKMAIFLWAAVRARLNILVSGGTGSGKTVMLNVLSNFIPPWERLVTCEDAAELQLYHENWVALESRPPNIEGEGAIPIRELVRNALRMRPDRIIIGECRGPEALDMIQAMNTGHDGSMSTLHSNSPRDTIYRLETMMMMVPGMQLPQQAIARQIASAVDLIVHLSRLSDGSRKTVSITEVQGLEKEVVLLQEIYAFEQKGLDSQGKVIGRHVCTGFRPHAADKIKEQGIEIPEDLFVPG
ncbi:MAG: CpaF family protein [Armatimonadetes bacterium]|nr:CpaF family protein [Armatimonadota bacterium]MDW8120921.1 CpaF family protein [Armatimonadota bacterium]